MTTTECSNCGAAAKVCRGDYHFVECGLPHVILHRIELVRCAACGNVDPIIPNAGGLMRLLAGALLTKPCRLTGEELRFLRKYLRFTGAEFARYLHVDKTKISKWENNQDRIGDQSDKLIRTVAAVLGEGLREELDRVVRAFPEMRDCNDALSISMDPERMQFEYA